jgi:hypothetical protein
VNAALETLRKGGSRTAPQQEGSNTVGRRLEDNPRGLVGARHASPFLNKITSRRGRRMRRPYQYKRNLTHKPQHQHSLTFSLQPSAFSLQPSAFSLQPSAFSLQPSALSIAIIAIAVLTLAAFTTFLCFYRQRGHRAGFETLDADFFAGLGAIAIATIFDAIERFFDLTD